MQSTENKQPAKEELIAHIRESLKTHEDDYKLGAWEKFNQKKETKRTPIFWLTRLTGIAAILTICFSLLLFNKNVPEKLEDNLVKSPISKSTPQQKDIAAPNENTEAIANYSTDGNLMPNKADFIAKNHQNENLINQELVINTSSVAIVNEVVTAENNQVATNTEKNNQTVQNAIADKQTGPQIASVADSKSKPTIEEFLANETKKNEQDNAKLFQHTKSKWALSLMVAPSFGNSKELNMGYGVSMGYNFSDKLSLITGISYNEMTASKDLPTTIGMSSILLGNSKSLAEISQKVSGLDIPLELKYSFNKSIYANVGVSAFAVLGQSRNNTFVQEVVVKGSVSNATATTGASSGASSSDASAAKGQFANSYIVNQKTVERASLEEQNNINYLGFYNFSIGFKRRVLKKQSIAIEPFIKLPIKQVTQDNLSLLGTGVRLKVDF